MRSLHTTARSIDRTSLAVFGLNACFRTYDTGFDFISESFRHSSLTSRGRTNFPSFAIALMIARLVTGDCCTAYP